MRKVFWFSMLFLWIVLFSANLGAADTGAVFDKSYKAEASGDLEFAYTVMYSSYDGKMDKTIKYAFKMRMGYIKGVQKKYNEAAVHYAEAAELMSSAVEPLVYQSYHLLMLAEWKKLADVSAKALSIDSKNYYLRSRLACANFYLGDYAGSVKEYYKVLELYPSDLEAKTMLAWGLVYTKDKYKAAQLFQEVISVYPSSESAKQGLEYIKNLR